MGRLKEFSIIILLILLITVPISGCKKKAPAPAKKPEVKKEEVRPEALTQPTVPETKGYTYEPAGRRDPFTPLIEIKKAKKGPAKGERPPGTLESYDVGDFTLIAIVKKGSKYYALLRSPDNKSFTVNEGDIIGLHNGKIERIMDNSVVVLEYIEDYKGNKKPKEIVLELHKEG